MSLSCQEIRRRLPLREELPDQQIEAHLPGCPACQRAAAWHASLDMALRSELLHTAPPELTARLVALLPSLHPGMVRRSKRWYRQRRIALLLGSLLAAVSLFVLMLGLSWALRWLGADQLVTALLSWPGALIDLLYRWLPSSRFVVEALLRLREPLQWALLAMLLWGALERLRPARDTAISSA